MVIYAKKITVMHFLGKALDKGRKCSRFHPHSGYRWLSDEARLEKMRQELSKPKSLRQDFQIMDPTKFHQDVESIIQETFSSSKSNS